MAAWCTWKSGPWRVHLATARGVLVRTSLSETARPFLAALRRDFPYEWRADPPDPILTEAAAQLAAYFSRTLRTLDLPLLEPPTLFQRQVWQAVRAIPYGEVRSYQEVAAAAGRPKAMRAVGNTMNLCGLTPFIPCHRVVAAGGRLGGWGSDPTLKQRLLDLERK